MKKIVARVLVGIFALVAIFVTLNLLAYNDYEVAEFGSKSFVLVDEHMQEYGYNKGDLLVATRVKSNAINKEDTILYYNNYAEDVTIDQGKVEEVSDDGKHYYLNGNSVAHEYVIGTGDTIHTYPVVGGVLQVLEARTGYLLLIILPTLALFAYLIRKIVVELKEDKKKN
jgi:hypothetical protein